MAQLSKIGVIGAGHMGSGIAQKAAQEGFDVVLVDVSRETVENGLATIRSVLNSGVQRRIFTEKKVDEILNRINPATDYKAVSDADIVIEAVFEDKAVKAQLFRQLDDICDRKSILATNTSSFYVHEFAGQVKRPDRFIGLHYFFHPAKNRLLEIIPHAGTSPETIQRAEVFANRHGKTAITVKDAPGFAVNRFFIPSYNEACRMLEEGMGNLATIEAGSKRAFGIGMGSFEIMNVTGIPLAVHAAQSMSNELGGFYQPPDILKRQMEKKQDWDLDDGPVAADRIDAIVDRFYGVCLGVAATLVDEGVATIEDIDLGAKIGLRWKQGPFEIMNRIGIDRTCQLVDAMADKYADFHLPQTLIRQKGLAKPFAFKRVNLDIEADIAFVTINRPDAMNALNETVMTQLAEAVDRACRDDRVKAIVFRGAGKAFVAGADIQFFVDKIRTGRIQDIETFTRQGHELFLAIENCPKKTIALLDGLSLGGGSEMALACQAVIATDTGSMGFPETGIGIIPGLGGMFRLARQVGPALAKYYVFTGEVLNARDAMDLGIITAVVDPDDIPAAIRRMVDQPAIDKYRKRQVPERFKAKAALCSEANLDALLAGNAQAKGAVDVAERAIRKIGYKSPMALRLANRILDQQITMSIPEAIAFELGHIDTLFSTKDALEGLASAGVRKPVFTGK